ncbi:NAD-dependent epimerase/dehydratase family protein [Pelosinus sp. sgz500959]|uniref:NAD-dependent epimerase/dehydratase family protein n=1 Tax=Pelosinus sp. sgz500959 TaxID=3242472 RepID=UPI00367362FE
MKSKTVIISGANGYFGGIACQYFRSLGWKVLKATRLKGDDLFFDLNNPKTASIQTEMDVDLFIHAAAAHEVACREDPYQSIYQNVIGTKIALDFCVSNHIKKFIYLSTFHVFGDPEGLINEEAMPCPMNDYGMSHLQAEQYVQMYTATKKILGTVIRPSNFFGVPLPIEDCKRWSLIPLAFCKEAVETGKIILNTPGFQRRNFIEVHDICKVIETVYPLMEKVPLLHIHGKDQLSIREFAYLIQSVIKKEYNKDIEVIFPEGAHSEKVFQYESLYLKDIYIPDKRIENFVKELLQCLLIKKATLTR